MNKAYLKFYNFLLRKSYFSQIIIFYLLTFLVAIISLPLQLLAVQVAGNESAGPKGHNLLVATLIMPIIETLVFQHWVFKLLEKTGLKKNKYLWIIIISSVLFGISHDYSLRYVVFAVSEGFVLAYTYYFYRKNTAKAFWTTTLIHCLRNGTTALILYTCENLN